MPEYDNTNTGTLFPNDKGDNPKRPDLTGTIDVDGRKLRLAAWTRTTKKDETEFLSLRVSELNGKKDNGSPF